MTKITDKNRDKAIELLSRSEARDYIESGEIAGLYELLKGGWTGYSSYTNGELCGEINSLEEEIGVEGIEELAKYILIDI